MAINETFRGFIETTTDALLVFEACRRGTLSKISRRLQEKERSAIRSGTVFVFDEKESGIKRWTDGFVWSPSRILGNFLIYRELDGRESLHQKHRFDGTSLQTSYMSRYQQAPHYLLEEEIEAEENLFDSLSNEERNRERNLVGSLTDTYKFRNGGLIKKTISIHLNGSTQHLISYYTKSDVIESKLATPSSISELSSLQIPPELLLRQSFRVPPSVEFAELMLKRPSLSPSSTNSSTSSNSSSRRISSVTTPSSMSHHQHFPFHEHQRANNDDHSLSLDHSRRFSFESSGNNTIKYARMSIDSSHSSTGDSPTMIRHRASIMTHTVPDRYNMPPLSTVTENIQYDRCYEERGRAHIASNTAFHPTFNRAPVIHENSGYGATAPNPLQNIATPHPSASSAPMHGNIDAGQQRRHSNASYLQSSSSGHSTSLPALTAASSISSSPRFHQRPYDSGMPSSVNTAQQKEPYSYHRHSPSLPSPSSLIRSNTPQYHQQNQNEPKYSSSYSSSSTNALVSPTSSMESSPFMLGNTYNNNNNNTTTATGPFIHPHHNHSPSTEVSPIHENQSDRYNNAARYDKFTHSTSFNNTSQHSFHTSQQQQHHHQNFTSSNSMRNLYT